MGNLKFYYWLIIGFVGMIIVGFGIGYVVDRLKDRGVQGTQIQVSPSQTIGSSPTQTPEQKPIEEPTQQATITPKPVYQPTSESTAESTPEPTPASTSTPTCDQSRKAEITTQYNSDIARILAVKNKKWDDALTDYQYHITIMNLDLASKILDDARELANMEYDGDKAYLDAMYNLDLKSINCSN